MPGALVPVAAVVLMLSVEGRRRGSASRGRRDLALEAEVEVDAGGQSRSSSSTSFSVRGATRCTLGKIIAPVLCPSLCHSAAVFSPSTPHEPILLLRPSETLGCCLPAPGDELQPEATSEPGSVSLAGLTSRPDAGSKASEDNEAGLKGIEEETKTGRAKTGSSPRATAYADVYVYVAISATASASVFISSPNSESEVGVESELESGAGVEEGRE